MQIELLIALVSSNPFRSLFHSAVCYYIESKIAMHSRNASFEEFETFLRMAYPDKAILQLDPAIKLAFAAKMQSSGIGPFNLDEHLFSYYLTRPNPVTEQVAQKRKMTTAASELQPIQEKKHKPVMQKEDILLVEGTATWLPYVEYKTQLLKIADKKAPKGVLNSTRYRCTQLLNILRNPTFFQYEKSDQSYNTWVTWTNHMDLLIHVKVIGDKQFNFQFKTVDTNKIVNTLVEIRINVTKNKVTIIKHEPKNNWQQTDFDDIASDFYALFPTATFKDQPFTVDLLQRDKTTSDQFSEVITHYKNHNITTRLQKTINGPSVFWLTHNNVDVKVTVENAPFSSYIFSEKELMKRYYPNDTFSQPLRYYRVKMFEANSKNQQLLELWSTLEALVLEIYKIHAVKNISGSIAIQILKQFLELLKPENYYLHDVSNIAIKKPHKNGKKSRQIRLPLRVIKMLTEGETWYEKHLNVRALNMSHWQSHWNDTITLSQNAARFYEAANTLRTLPFESLLKVWSEEADWLISVANTYYPNTPHSELFAKDIFTSIFSKENMETANGYNDLTKLYAKLELEYLEDDIDEADVKLADVTNEITKTEVVKTDKDIVQLCKVMGYTRFFARLSEEKSTTVNEPTLATSAKKSKPYF